MESLASSAEFYARDFGWHVFPVWGVTDGVCDCGGLESCNGGKSAGKHPLTPKGHLDSSADPATVRRIWEKHPNANIALACDRSGLVVVDIDPRNDGDATWATIEAKHRPISSPMTATTGGGGRHLFFAEPDESWAAERLTGIDIKHHGYVILSPSAHKSGGRYAWEPGRGPGDVIWEIDGLPPLPAAFWEPADAPADDSGTPPLGRSEVQLKRTLEGFDPDEGRDAWLRVGAALHHETGGGDLGLAVWTDWSRRSKDFDVREIRKDWRSFDRRRRGAPVTWRSIEREAEDRGAWVPEVDYVAEFDDRPAPRTLAAGLAATPFRWVEPGLIPRREWLYGSAYIRRYVSATVAPGGSGKSSLIVAEALAMASGRPLLGEAVKGGPLRVWYVNLEDPADELLRRFAAAMAHYQLGAGDVADRLFVNGRGTELVLATEGKNGIAVASDLVAALIAEIRAKRVDVLAVDPFISSHDVNENSNTAVDRVVKTWARIADDANCAVHFVHHVRKAAHGQGDTTAEDARGAGALVAAARSVRVINRMGTDLAERWRIPDRWRYIRVDDGKANLAPPTTEGIWRKLTTVGLGNGDAEHAEDFVGVIERWEVPGPALDSETVDLSVVMARLRNGEWRESSQSPQWAGYAVAEATGLDLEAAGNRDAIKQWLREWRSRGMLRVVERPDAGRKMRTYFEVVDAVGAGAFDLDVST